MSASPSTAASRKASAKAHAYDHAAKEDGVARQHARGRASHVAREVHLLVDVQSRARRRTCAPTSPLGTSTCAMALSNSLDEAEQKRSERSPRRPGTRGCAAAERTVSTKRRDRAADAAAPEHARTPTRLACLRVVELVLVQHLVLGVDDAPAALAHGKKLARALAEPRERSPARSRASSAGSGRAAGRRARVRAGKWSVRLF